MAQPPEQTIYLADYTPPAFLIETVELVFSLHPTATKVRSRIRFRPNPDAQDREFFLHGEGLKLLSSRIDGQEVTPHFTENGLTCDVPAPPVTMQTGPPTFCLANRVPARV